MKAYLGIDPGQTGAAALIVLDRIFGDKFDVSDIDYFDWPGDEEAVVDRMGEWFVIFGCNIEFAILEKVSAMPKQGVSSTFKFGANYGIWRGILASFKIPFDLVTPQKWQKGLITKSDGKDSKERSLAVARRLFPNVDFLKRKKDHGRADALLMAEYARRLKI